MLNGSNGNGNGRPPITIVVEDDSVLNELICRTLKREGIECEGFLSGADGLKKAAEEPEGLMLLDYKLPDMTALEVIETMEERGLANPFMITTGFGDEELAVKLMKRGALDYLVKGPEFVRKLPQVVKNILKHLQVSKKLAEAEEELKESEKRYRSLFEEMIDGFATHEMIVDERGEPVDYIFIEVNSAYERLVGRKREELLGRRVTEVFPGIRNDHPNWIGKYSKVAYGGGYQSFEDYSEILGKWLSVHAYSTKRGTFASVLEDISQRKDSEETIRRSLEEKEVLLKEIHHRVKNNLQIISSLINLESRKNQALGKGDVFKDILNRIRSISLIHENLYRSKDLGSIDISVYFSDLINNLTITYDIDPANLSINTDMEQVSIGLDTLVPCGLILNEMISNSLKYAFPDGRKGEIYFSLKILEDDQIEMIYSDNGIGLPEGIKISDLDSLGMKLIHNLTEMQLKGRVEVESNEGTTFTIRFKDYNFKRRMQK